ncbi:hypothetical protein ABE437_09510 [Isoptericola cucumis]|uniref:hypothetical protein n=1 Tax=Isoptericola cucumis TaxID=1776856 RepID=UPI0032090981
MSSRHVTGPHDDQGPGLLQGAAVVGVALIQAGLVGLVVSTWWRHAGNIIQAPEIGSVLWHVLTAVLFVWVLVAEIRGLVRGRKTPLLVVSLATGAMVVVVLLEALGPR